MCVDERMRWNVEMESNKQPKAVYIAGSADLCPKYVWAT